MGALGTENGIHKKIHKGRQPQAVRHKSFGSSFSVRCVTGSTDKKGENLESQDLI